MPKRSLRYRQVGGPWDATVEVGGVDVSHALHSVEFVSSARAGGKNAVTLHADVEGLDVDVSSIDVRVALPDSLRSLLIAAGWTPPAEPGDLCASTP